MPQRKGTSAGGLDAMAQEKGFPNYAAWKAWNEKYRSAKTNKVPQKKPKNFFQTMITKSHPLMHSADKASKAMQGARKP